MGVNNRTRNTKFKSVIRRIKSSPSLRHGISHLKSNYSFNDIEDLINILLNVPYYRTIILGCPFPNQIEKLANYPILYAVDDIEREFYWSAIIIKKYSNKINSFIKLRNKYIYYFLNSEYDKAGEILEDIERQFGYSLWLLETKISFIEETQGLEKQKEYTNSITNNDNVSGIIRFLVSYLSIKAEKNVSPNKYNSRIKSLESEFKEGNFGIGFQNYISFKLNLERIRNYDYSLIFTYESSLSVIDRYLTFVKLSQFYSIHNQELKKINNSVLMLCEVIDDNELRNLSILQKIDNGIKFEQKEVNILMALDKYTEGSYKDCILYCESILKEQPFVVEIYEIYVKSYIYSSSTFKAKEYTTLLYKILEALQDVILINEKSDESYIDTLKLTYTYSSQPWAWQLRGILNELYFGDINDEQKKFVHIGKLHSRSINPILVDVLSSYDQKVKFLEFLRGKDKGSSTILLFQGKHDYNIKKLQSLLPKERFIKCKAQVAYEKKSYIVSKQYYEKLVDSDNYIVQVEGILGKIHCMYYLNEFNECLDLIVETYFQNENFYTKFPIEKVLNKIEEGFFDNVSSNISLSITYDIYSKYYSTDKDTLKSDAYEDFLYSLSISRPSQIASLKNFFANEKIIYFLKNICVFNVMDNSIEFDNSEEVEQERILVCQLLSNIDPENTNEYLEEIKNITQKLMILKGMREIEKSKIYVDVEGIKKSLEKNLRESYTRYQSFTKSTYDRKAPEYIFVDSSEEDGVIIELRIPSNERQGLFTAMVLELRDNFVSSDEYGLDGYLSVGIRHGTLSGQLRGTLESEHLITQKDNNNNEYSPNTFWENICNPINENNQIRLLEIFAEFSREIDRLIDLLKNNWIQIKTENKNSKGLFEFLITLKDLDYLDANINSNTSYEKFIEMVFDMLWEKTEKNLANIRSKIGIELKDKFNNAFNNLQQSINSLDLLDKSELNAKIASAKTTTQYELDKIASWFTRGKTSESTDYNLDLPIDISLEMIKNIYTNKTLIIEDRQISEKMLKGKTLKSFVDICFILFDNIIKHNHLKENYPKVNVIFIEKNDFLYMTFINEVDSSVNIEKGNNSLESKRKDLLDDKALERVSKEGGTGLFKVKKIISIDLNCSYTIDFKYLEEHKFIINIKINSKGLFV